MNRELKRGVEAVIDPAELDALLAGSKKLRLKLGVDPSSPDIHLGHAVLLRCLARFQRLGHHVIFLIGDTTALIGDPSGKNKTRPVLTEAEVERNAQTYLDQVGKILDIKKAEVRRNSEWLGKLDLGELLKLASNFTVAQLVEREDFATRLKAGADLGLHELLYPLMVAYDSVALEADVEFGGTDQRFNLLAGRALQKKLGQRPQQIVMAKLLVGTDGTHKMSKSLGNYIGVAEGPAEMFGKVMSIPDDLIAPYYELCTDIDLDVIADLVKSLAEGANPRDAKASLAREITSIYHGEAAALAAEATFDRRFRDKTVADEDITDVAHVGASAELVDFLLAAEILPSRSEVRRKVEEGGIRVNGQKAEDMATTGPPRRSPCPL